MELTTVAERFLASVAAPYATWAECVEDRGYLRIILQRPKSLCRQSERLGDTFELMTNGAEAFFVIVDGRFHLTEFEYDDAEQVLLVERLARLANVFFDGLGKRVVKSRIFGPARTHMEFEENGNRYVLMSGSRKVGLGWTL